MRRCMYLVGNARVTNSQQGLPESRSYMPHQGGQRRFLKKEQVLLPRLDATESYIQIAVSHISVEVPCTAPHGRVLPQRSAPANHGLPQRGNPPKDAKLS